MYRLLVLAAVCAVAVSGIFVLNAGGSPSAPAKAQRTTTLRFDEKATSLKIIDNPPANTTQGPETGDTVVFRADLVSGNRKIGTDHGFCTVVEAPLGECAVTLFLAAGRVVGVDSFDFSTQRPQPFALIGGTRAYGGAHGQARIAQVTPTLAHWVVTLTR
jgi:hypothetical protein